MLVEEELECEAGAIREEHDLLEASINGVDGEESVMEEVPPSIIDDSLYSFLESSTRGTKRSRLLDEYDDSLGDEEDDGDAKLLARRHRWQPSRSMSLSINNKSSSSFIMKDGINDDDYDQRSSIKKRRIDLSGVDDDHEQDEEGSLNNSRAAPPVRSSYVPGRARRTVDSLLADLDAERQEGAKMGGLLAHALPSN